MATWYFVSKFVPDVIEVQALPARGGIHLLYQTRPRHTYPLAGEGYAYFSDRNAAEQQLNTWRTDEHFRPV